MKWFALLYFVTVYWGNGRVESPRTNWWGFFQGSSASCDQLAEETSIKETKALVDHISKHRGENTSHAEYPSVYNHGMVNASKVYIKCIEFPSANHIKEALPENWEFLTGCRKEGSVLCQPFDWAEQ